MNIMENLIKLNNTTDTSIHDELYELESEILSLECELDSKFNTYIVQDECIDVGYEILNNYYTIEDFNRIPEAKEMALHYLACLGAITTINKEGKPEYHEPEIDTKINKSLDINLSSMQKSIDICDKFKDLAIKEKDLVTKETPLSITALKKLSASPDTSIIQYEGLSIKELQNLYSTIKDANEKLIKIDKIIDPLKSLDKCSPSAIRKLAEKDDKLGINDITSEVLKVNPKLEDFINKNKDLFPLVGIGKLAMNDRTKLISFTGCHPRYKRKLHDKQYTLDISKSQSQLVQLFESKPKLNKYLDWVIQSPQLAIDTYNKLNSMYSSFMKLRNEDPKLFRLAMVGVSQVRSYIRFYAVIVYKVTKGTKYINRKIRLIQTRLKRKVK